MNIWSAKTLKIGYAKRIAGFDFRSLLDCNPVIAGNSPLTSSSMHEGNECLATLDNQIWPQVEFPNFSGDSNGFNLFDSLEECEHFTYKSKSLLAAFELPMALIDLLSSTFGVVASSFDLNATRSGWIFLGYDVVDIRTQSSAIHSFASSEIEFDNLLVKIKSNLNLYSLIINESESIEASIAFDYLLPEHAPFAPCGIWISGGMKGNEARRTSGSDLVMIHSST